MKKNLVKKIIPIISIVLLTGCGLGATKNDPGTTINEDMSVKSVIVEDFDESLYNVNELKAMIDSEVSDYNSLNGMDKVTSQEPELEDGKIKVIMNFASAEDFSGFNNQRFAIYSLTDALAGSMLGVGFVSADDSQLANLNEIDEPNLYSVLITDQVGIVTCPGKVAYISAGVNLDSKYKAVVSEDMDGLAYIIFKNK